MPVAVYKSRIAPNDTITVPKGSKLLTVQLQQQVPTIWYLCDPYAELEMRSIQVVMTGEHIDTVLPNYIGTVQAANGLVAHYFSD